MNLVTLRSNRSAAVAAAIGPAVARALNRAIDTVRTQTTRALAAETGLKQAIIRDRLPVQGARPDRLEAVLRVTGKRVPIVAFGARQTRQGVTYRLTGGRGLIPGAFLATMSSGHAGVFARRPISRSRAGNPRSSPGLPIVEQYGPSLPLVVTKQHILEAGQAIGEAAFTKNLTHELGRAVRGEG